MWMAKRKVKIHPRQAITLPIDLAKWKTLYPPLKRVTKPHSKVYPYEEPTDLDVHLDPDRRDNAIRTAQEGLARCICDTLNTSEQRYSQKSWPGLTKDAQKKYCEVLKGRRIGVLLTFPFKDRCMTWNERIVKRSKYMCASTKSRGDTTTRKGKYLIICVGKDSDNNQVWISAHGFISWMLRGTQRGILIQHKCNTSRCVNPLHVEPGDPKSNNHYINSSRKRRRT